MEQVSSGDNIEDAQLFFVPASGTEAKKHISLSISRPISQETLDRYLPSEVHELVVEPDGSVYAWAARPGKRNIPTWQSMRRGDIVAFYSQGLYSYVATVKFTRQDPLFAEMVWGKDSAGRAWEYLFFLTKPRRVDVPLDRLGDYLQESAYQGFLKLPEDWKTKILADYDTINEFVTDKLLSLGDTPSNYVLIRSNEDSPWEDHRESYHFGRKVPNYKKLRVGTAVAIDTRQQSGIMLLGTGRITDILEQDDGTFRAVMDVEHRTPRPLTPTEENLLKTQPNYNQQHAVRPINAELFRSLAGASAITSESSNQDDARTLADLLFWPKADADRLLELASRSRALLFFGPPGTGKTRAAKTLADVICESPADIETVVFHPAYSYEDFVEGIRPNVVGETLTYRLHKGTLLRSIERAASYNDGRRVVLIIDELTRGNVPRIFGELIHSIEYRGKDNQVVLPSGGTLSVPDNLLIIATMNTADRSVVGLDAALRRRFEHVRFDPNYTALRSFLSPRYGEETADDAVSRIEALNEELDSILADRQMRIGHTFLMVDPLEGKAYERMWTEKLEPILLDYFLDRPEEVDRLREIFLATS